MSNAATDFDTSPVAMRVVSPDSTDAIAEYVRTTHAQSRVAGAGTWQNAGRPVVAEEIISTQGVARVVEYVPGDLVMTVQAGVSLAEIDRIAAAEAQWVGMDAAGVNAGTIGATVATASYGPLAHGIGRMRDIVLGVEVVTGDGRIIRSGGKVVKNVAGFDLVRLQTGAWGTLGIITEVSVRLRALPEVDETIAIAIDPRRQLSAQLVLLRDLPLNALAIELIGATLAQQLNLGDEATLLVRLGGNSTRVDAQKHALRTIGTLSSVDGGAWQTLRAIEHPLCAVARVTHLPTELANSWWHVHDTLSSASLSPVTARASVFRGMIRLVIPPPPDMTHAEFEAALSRVTQTIAPPGGHVVWEQLPPTAWNNVPSAVSDDISKGLQRAFDPAQRLNVGILGLVRA